MPKIFSVSLAQVCSQHIHIVVCSLTHKHCGTHTHTLTHPYQIDCYSWLAVPRSRHQEPWHTKALCHLLWRCSLLFPARQPALRCHWLDLLDALPLLSTAVGTQTQPNRPPIIFHSPLMLQNRQHTNTDIHIHIHTVHEHVCCVSTCTQTESTLVWPSHWPAHFLVIVVRNCTAKTCSEGGGI